MNKTAGEQLVELLIQADENFTLGDMVKLAEEVGIDVVGMPDSTKKIKLKDALATNLKED